MGISLDFPAGGFRSEASARPVIVLVKHYSEDHFFAQPVV
jgi:hypothetical protein